jgi:very-short-patch-repair endonuclease
MDALQSARLDRRTAFQVLLPFWQGRVDFYHISSRTVIQVDGCSHFTGTFYTTTRQQLMMDVSCCCKAWSTGVRMLRVHHMCTDYAAAMLTAVMQQYDSFVMLTQEYAQVQVCCQGQDQSFVQWVQQRLPSAHMITDPSTGYFLFVPLTM